MWLFEEKFRDTKNVSQKLKNTQKEVLIFGYLDLHNW